MEWLKIKESISKQDTDYIVFDDVVFSTEDVTQLEILLAEFAHIRTITFSTTQLTYETLSQLMKIFERLNTIIKVDFINARFERSVEILIAKLKQIMQSRINEYKQLYNVCVHGEIELVKKYLIMGFHPNGLHCSEMKDQPGLLNGALLSKQFDVAILILKQKMDSCHKLGPNTLDLSNQHITSLALKVLLEELLNDTRFIQNSLLIQHIDLSNNPDIHVITISDKLPSCDFIKNNLVTLYLSSCGIRNNVFKELGVALSMSPRLEIIVVNDNEIEYDGLKRFLQYFNAEKPLKLLSLKGNLIERNADTLEEVTILIKGNKKIHTVDLSGNYLLNSYSENLETERIPMLNNIRLGEYEKNKGLLHNGCISKDYWKVYLLAVRIDSSVAESIFSTIDFQLGGHVMLAFEGITDYGQRIFKVAHLTAEKSFGSQNIVKISYFTRQESLLDLISYIKRRWYIANFETKRENCLSLWREIEKEITEGVPYQYRPVAIHTSSIFSTEHQEKQIIVNCVKWAMEKIEKHLKIALPASIGCLPLPIVRDSLNGRWQEKQDFSPDKNTSYCCII